MTLEPIAETSMGVLLQEFLQEWFVQTLLR